MSIVKAEVELGLIRDHGVKILRLAEIVEALKVSGKPVPSAAGQDVVDLMQMGAKSS